MPGAALLPHGRPVGMEMARTLPGKDRGVVLDDVDLLAGGPPVPAMFR